MQALQACRLCRHAGFAEGRHFKGGVKKTAVAQPLRNAADASRPSWLRLALFGSGGLSLVPPGPLWFRPALFGAGGLSLVQAGSLLNVFKNQGYFKNPACSP
jgi:hypothetical protein